MTLEKDTNSSEYALFIHAEVDKVFQKFKQRDADRLRRIWKKIGQIKANPEEFKPLRNDLRNHRRVQIGSFVLIYKIEDSSIAVIAFNHHDNVYKK